MNLQKDLINKHIRPQKQDFFSLSINDIIRGFGERRFRPSDIAEICIQRFEKLNKQYHVWTNFDAHYLRRQARDADQAIDRGGLIKPLHGIPIGLKDIFNTIDFETEMGSAVWKGFTPGNDARVVHELRHFGGAIVPGKLHTAEFAVHTLGATVNPHNIAYSPGTSSSGSAVAVSLGMVPVSLGTQTAGSIVRPASFCGIYGMKPSFGLVPRIGILKTADSLDSVGFFVMHQEDLKRVFQSLHVKGLNHPISNRYLTNPSVNNKPKKRPWRVAVIRSCVDKYVPDYAGEQFESWVKKLSQDINIDVEEVALPDEMLEAHRVHSTIYDKSLSYYFQREFRKKELVSNLMSEAIESGNKITLEEYRDALSKQKKLADSMNNFLEGYDVSVTLSTSGIAPLRDEREKPDTCLIWNLAYLPVLSAPVFSADNGMPFGVQIFSKRYYDYRLLNFSDYLRSIDLIPRTSNPVCRR